MLRRTFTTLVAIHFELYQSLLAILGMVAVNRILFDFSWGRAVGYGLVTVIAYWVGQGIVALLQRPVARRYD